jgi:ABC-2 type transport system ATP-binding protein
MQFPRVTVDQLGGDCALVPDEICYVFERHPVGAEEGDERVAQLPRHPVGTQASWMRDLLRQLASEGRTVLVSSHLLAETAQTVDDVVVITRGRLATKGPVAELAAATSTTRIRTPDSGRLTSALAAQHITARPVAPGIVEIRGADPDRVARIAAAAGVLVLELTRHTDNLEELFFEVTSDRANDRALEACPS